MVRRHWLRAARWGLGAAMFAGLFAAFVDFRSLVPAPFAHSLAAVQFVPAVMALAAGSLAGLAAFIGLALTVLGGRIYCSVVCPLGVLQDVIARLAAVFRRGPRRLPYRPAVRWLRHLFVGATVAGIVAGGAGFTLSLVDPYSNFGRMASGLMRPAIVAANNAVVGPANAAGLAAWYRVDIRWAGDGALQQPALWLLLIVFLVVWRARFYCNTLCPVGTVLGWIARHATWRLAIDESACTKCGDCLRVCKAQCIDLRNGDVDFSRCIACFNCVTVCSQQGIGYRFSWRKGPPPETKPALSVDARKTKRETPATALNPPAPDPERRAFLTETGEALVAATGVATLLALANTRAGAATPAAAKNTDDRSPMPDREASRAICPPGADGVDRFLRRCTACQLCISACPTHVLQPAFIEYGLTGMMKPRLDYLIAFCNFDCRRCAEVCPDEAIDLLALADKQLTRIGRARLEIDKCIVKTKGTDCAACSEHCPTKAVETIPYGNNLRLPQLADELCIGCGACEFACPVRPAKAISVTGLRRHDRAQKRKEQKAEAPKRDGDFPF